MRSLASSSDFLVLTRRSPDLHLPKLRLPALAPVAPIEVEFLPSLTRHGNQLLSGSPRGTPVHAATFLRQRRMVLESELLADPNELRRIFVHELFHFVWLRLGNPRRLAWEQLLVKESEAHARGELGWSAEWRKQALDPADRARRTISWREYICESFCDSAAWRFAGSPRHDEYTLATRWSTRRRSYLEGLSARPLAL